MEGPVPFFLGRDVCYWRQSRHNAALMHLRHFLLKGQTGVGASAGLAHFIASLTHRVDCRKPGVEFAFLIFVGMLVLTIYP